MEQPKRGFIAPTITEDQHILGSVGIPLPVIKENGDWTADVPEFESQLDNDGWDPDDCTVAGTLYAISTLEKFLYGVNIKHSRRFVYNAAEMSPPGDDPHRIITVIRGQGLVLESDLPDDVKTLAEFMTPRPLTVDLQIKGQKFLNKQQIGHQWIWESQPDQATRLSLIKEALTKGTVAVSVSAWWQNSDGLYYSPLGLQNGHWVHVYKVDDTGIYVFDSYNDAVTNTNLKKLTLDHNIQFAKVYFFTVPTQQQSWFSQFITALLKLVGIEQKQLDKVQTTVTPPTPVVPVVTTSPVLAPKYIWNTVSDAKHSVRVICDEEGLDLEQKNTMCATIGGESGWMSYYLEGPKKGLPVKRENYVDGKLDSTDWGICQWNDWYHAKEITVDESLNNPEKAVRLMSAYWKRGDRNEWIAYKNGSYKKYF